MPAFRLYDAACLTCLIHILLGGCRCFLRWGSPLGCWECMRSLLLLLTPALLRPPSPLLLGARAAPRLLGMYEGPLVLPSSSPLARPAAVYCVHASGCREVDVPFTSVLACICAEFPHARTLSLHVYPPFGPHLTARGHLGGQPEVSSHLIGCSVLHIGARRGQTVKRLSPIWCPKCVKRHPWGAAGARWGPFGVQLLVF